MKKISIFLMLLMAFCVPLALNAQTTMTVCSGTETNAAIPLNAYSSDTQGSTGEFIIPSNYLTPMAGKVITGIEFYIDDNGYEWNSTFQVYMKEVPVTTLSSTYGPGACTVVYTGALDGSTGTVAINFTTNYTYNGGNLLIGTYISTAGDYEGQTNFLGVAATGASYASGTWNNGNDGSYDFIPKTTFTYLTNDPYITLSPTTATVFTGYTQTLTATYGNVTGTPTISYRSSNTRVATVTSTGSTTATVTGVAAGSATITATMTVNGTDYHATCAITVEDPSYCSPSFSNPSDDYISNFTTTGGDSNINNSSTYVSGGYSDYYNSYSASIEQGSTLTCSVTPSSTSWSYGHAIWVDWNNDFTFGSDEKVAYTSSAAKGVWTANFTVPATATGDYRMRVIHYYNNNPTDPCMSASYGEAEDYKLIVFAASSDPSITLSPATATVYVGNTETLTAVVRNVTSPTITYTSSNTSVATVTGNGTTATVTALATGNTTITASMTVSGTTYTATSTITVATDPCAKTIPYTYGFEDATDYNNCWNTEDCETDTDNGISGLVTYAGYANSGSSFFAFSSYGGSTIPQYLVSPQLTGIQNGLHVEFYYCSIDDGYNETFKVGYSTTNNNTSSFTWDSETTSSSATYTLYKKDLPAGTKYIAIQYTSQNKYYLLLDDFTFEEAASCLEPTNVLASNETTTSATISWTAGASETEWDLYYTDNASDVPTASTTPSISGITTNSRDLTSLTPATIYYVYVRAVCSASDKSAWSTSCVFNTECIAMDLPFTYGFEDNALSVCWGIINANDSYNHVSITNSYTPYAGSGHLDLRRGSTEGTEIVVLPEANANYQLNSCKVSFYAKYANASTNYGYTATLSVGIMTDPSDESTFTQLGSSITLTSTYTYYEIDFSSYTGNGRYIAIKNASTAGNGDSFIDNLEVTVNAYTKTITGVGDNWNNQNNGGYYLIASPLAASVDPTTITGMINDNYDLYSFNQAEADEWRNYKNSNFNLVNGHGYLYSSKETVTLTFTGAAGTNGSVTLSKTNDNTVDFQGWNLVGNPFAVTAYINKPFYTLENSNVFEEKTAGDPIQLMQGLLVVADNDGETLTFSTTAPTNKVAKLNMNVSKDRSVVDHAIISFNDGQQLPKIQFINGSTKVYIPQEGKDYAIVSAESNMGEMPVNFKAENNGTYTLSFTSEEVSFAYLHLIDNMTGNDVDLLANPSYSFNAKTTDYESRFKLVFATGNNANDDNFAFYSNGSFVINNEGEATLQVIDINGRLLKSESINGCTNVNVNAAQGIYMLRLVNGNDVKVQKVVVR